MSDMTRRNFIGASGAAAGMALATSVHRTAHGDSDKIRLGIIGAGTRGQQHLHEGLWGSKDFEIVAVADVYGQNKSSVRSNAWIANAGITVPIGGRPSPEQLGTLEKVLKPTAYYDYKEMLAKEHLTAVVIATPPHTHASIIQDCLAAGKHVFCETPMTTRVDDARKVVTEAQKSGLIVQIGHQRRYHPNYNLVTKYLHDALPLGRPTQVETYCHRNTHDRRELTKSPAFTPKEQRLIAMDLEHFTNWRLYAQPDGGPCLDALPRALDTANWICGSPPVRVYASGGTDYWRDGRDTPDNLSVVFDYRIDSSSEQFVHMDSRFELQDVQAINRSYVLRSTFSYALSNREHREHERVIGDRASAVLAPRGDCVYFLETMAEMPWALRRDHLDVLHAGLKKKLAKWPEKEREQFWVTRGASYDPPGVFDGPRSKVPITALGSEESAEVHQFRAFADHIRNGGTPRANVMVGLAAVIAGESARRSYETGLPVDIDPALMDFDFETPSISLYDTNAAPIPGTTELM